ncbi:MAG: BspA family leucine-rich repeat surface protein [Spirochaetia bacterium]|nr:BspA family leucine-rich repeat surface protein [Spirochaetia bacterium]
MKAKVSSIIAAVSLITALFFCILSCDNGSVSDSSANKSDGLVNVSLTVGEQTSDNQKSISVDSSIDPANLKFYYRATPQWSQSSPIHGSTNNQFVLIPNFSAGSPVSLGSFTAGQWIFDVQVKNGSTLVYQGTSDVTSIYQGNVSVSVMVSKIIQQASGSVIVNVTAPTVDAEALTVGWTGTASSSGNAVATPLGDGTTQFSYSTSALSSGYYTFTLNHSSTGSGAAVAVDLRSGERVEITGHLENGVWQVGYVTVKVYTITINAEGCVVNANTTSAAAGDKVTFYATPFTGNVLDEITVTWAGGTIIPAVSGDMYTFTMPSGDVSVTASYSGVSADIVVSHFRAIFKILHDDNPLATSFGRSLTEPSDDVDEYFEIKNVKMWYDSDSRKICWHSDDGTMKFQPGSLAGLFKDCSAFTAISLEGMDTSAITDMSGMFQNCTALADLNLGNMDTGSVTDMSRMFMGCYALTGIDFGSNFDTSSVTDMSYMFSSADISHSGQPPKMNFQSLDVSGFDTSSVTNMSHMFYQCSNANLTVLDVSGFRTPLVTDMSYMFACYMNQPSYVSVLDLSGWDFTNVTTVANMFDRCEYLDTGLTFPDTTNFASLTTMTYFFSQCLALTPATFTNIVSTWTFAGQDDYEKNVYGIGHDAPNKTLFGNAENNNKGQNTGANYIFRENTMTGSGKKFAVRQSYTTKDGKNLWIGGGTNSKHARLTMEESI